MVMGVVQPTTLTVTVKSFVLLELQVGNVLILKESAPE